MKSRVKDKKPAEMNEQAATGEGAVDNGSCVLVNIFCRSCRSYVSLIGGSLVLISTYFKASSSNP